MATAAALPAPAAKPAQPAPKKVDILRRLLGSLGPYRRYFFLGLLLTVVGSAVAPLRPFLFQYVLDGPVARGELGQLRMWFGVLVGLLLLQTVLQYATTLTTNLLGQLVMNDLRQQVFRHILRLRLRYFDTNPIGTLQTRTVSDIQTLNSVLSEGLVTILGELLQLVFILGVMLWVDWELTLVVLSTVPIMLLVTRVFQVRVRAAFNRVRRYVAQLNAFLQEHITGMLVTQIFSREQEEYRRFVEINRQHRKAHLDTVLYYSIFFPAVEIIASLSLAILVWYGSNGALEGRLSFGVLVSFILYSSMFFRPIRMLADQFNTLQMGIVSGERIYRVLDTDEFIPEKPNALPEVPGTEPLPIAFEGVTFSYDGKRDILHNVSFEVPAGTTTAIVGATGAGKSSVINLLMRLYEFQAGTIRLGGHDIRDLQLEALRRTIGLVQQDVFLFSGSILDNITLFNPAISRAAVQEAARLVGADRFIEQLPGGYDYKVGERGATLSSGQRQLISFIRVLVYNPRVLVLDEATSNIDSETEQLIQRAIETVLRGRTAILIAHRLSTVQKAQQILVLHKGELVERGTHQSLLAQNGFYKKLYLIQYGTKALAEQPS